MRFDKDEKKTILYFLIGYFFILGLLVLIGLVLRLLGIDFKAEWVF